MSASRDYARTWQALGYCIPPCCPVCGLNYAREVEEYRRVHRSQHRQVLRVYEPKPNLRLAALYAEHGAFVPLNSRSPRWLRGRLDGMASLSVRSSHVAGRTGQYLMPSPTLFYCRAAPQADRGRSRCGAAWLQRPRAFHLLTPPVSVRTERG